MFRHQWLQPPRHLLGLFLAITLAPALVLGWLSWRMIEQDRALESHRLQERREHAVDLAAAALQRILAEVEEQLTSFSALPNAQAAANAGRPENLGRDAVLVVFDSQGTLNHAGVGLPYYPSLPRYREPPEGVFSAGEGLEFQKRDYAGAIRAFRELARSAEPMVRAGALVRLARNLRKAGKLAEALGAFDELAKLGSTSVGGLPAELVARQGRALLFEQLGRAEDLKREASALYRDLQGGRWQLARASYRFLVGQACQWLGRQPVPPSEGDALALAAGAESFWSEWRNGGLIEGKGRGRHTIWVDERSVLLLWRASPQRLALVAIGPRFLESRWLRGLEPLMKSQRVQFALTDAEGHPVLGRLESATPREAIRTASAAGLPWTLHTVSSGAGAGPDELSGRRRLLLAGLAMMAVLMIAGSYFITRAISRELAVARLQSDFVSAVSHEFRSPLTTLRQLSELLLRGRVSSEERRRQFYEELVRESERLHRLVESLLNFGRMEAGAQQYRFEAVDPVSLLQNIVNEFQQEVSKDGYRIELNENGKLPPIRADRESLGRVFWNLLENAVKYSPEFRTVWVDLAREEERLAVRVRDRGLGIPAEEQTEIFRKFVRGAASKASSISGTGLGLAMARQIVEAHGGEITVESAPGEGSTFSVLLPLATEA